MQILAPLNNLKEVSSLIKAGADELFCGVLEDKWINKYTCSYACNKRTRPGASLQSFDELRKCHELVSSFDKELTFILNNFYVKSQKDDVLDMLQKAINIGVKNIIVTDFFTLEKVKQAGLTPILSCTSPVLNKGAAEFYRQLGVKRLILPRDMGLNEIAKITSGVNMNFEILILNDGCSNIDGLCRFFHGQDENNEFLPLACSLKYKIKLKIRDIAKNSNPKQYIPLIRRLNQLTYPHRCGACFLPELDKAGVSHLKISGREFSTEMKIKDIEFIKSRLKALNSSDYKEETRYEFEKVYHNTCGKRCYLKN